MKNVEQYESPFQENIQTFENYHSSHETQDYGSIESFYDEEDFLDEEEFASLDGLTTGESFSDEIDHEDLVDEEYFRAEFPDETEFNDQEEFIQFEELTWEPDPIPEPNQKIAFASLPAGICYWPIASDEKRIVSYAYRDASDRIKYIGTPGMRFLAERSNGTRWHMGIDLPAKTGQTVLACENGKIVFFGQFYKANSGQMTYQLLVSHNDKVVNYGEVTSDSLSRNNLKVHDFVSAGQPIGFVSDTRMLHFETYISGTTSNKRWLKTELTPPREALNPTNYLLYLKDKGNAQGVNGTTLNLGSTQQPSSYINIGRAIQENRKYASSVGWQNQRYEIYQLLGFTNMSPNEELFAEALAKWQKSNGLKDDGILGPNTWRVLQARLPETYRTGSSNGHTLMSNPSVPVAVTQQTSQLSLILNQIRITPKTIIPPRTRRTVVDGYERVEPRGDIWCNQAGLTQDEGALARMVASEVGTLPSQYMIAVVEATLNEAAAKRISVFQRITMQGLKLKGGVTPKSSGYFGRQSGRWCASIADPTYQHLAAVRVALSAPNRLISEEARRWVDGKVMDRGLQDGKKLKYNAVTIVEAWGNEGWEWIGPSYDSNGTLLLDPYILMLFRFVGRGKANIQRGVNAMLEGRRKWKK